MLLEEGVCYDQRVLIAKLLALRGFTFYTMAKLAYYSRYPLTSHFCIQVLSHIQLFSTPLTIARQGSLSMEFSRQEYQSG